MANYSTDTDLSIYDADYATLGTLTAFHVAAAKEINRRLYSKGLDDTDLSKLTTQTLSFLKDVAAFYVLYLAYTSKSYAFPVMADRAAHFLKRFEDTIATTKIEVDIDNDGVPDEVVFVGGDILLG
jgi:hypothetical protein